MTERVTGPASYFPGIEARYGRPIGEWQQLLADHLEGAPTSRHGELVTWLKTEHGMGHGHANALVAHTLAARRP